MRVIATENFNWAGCDYVQGQEIEVDEMVGNRMLGFGHVAVIAEGKSMTPQYENKSMSVVEQVKKAITKKGSKNGKPE